MHRFAVLAASILFLSAVSAAGADTREEQFWQAARDGDVARVRALLADGVAVDSKTEFDCTALYFAANSNHPEVVRVLLEAGADVNVRDNSYGFTAISMAGSKAAVAARCRASRLPTRCRRV